MEYFTDWKFVALDKSKEQADVVSKLQGFASFDDMRHQLRGDLDISSFCQLVMPINRHETDNEVFDKLVGEDMSDPAYDCLFIYYSDGSPRAWAMDLDSYCNEVGIAAN